MNLIAFCAFLNRGFLILVAVSFFFLLMMIDLKFVQKACTSCNLYKQFVQVATCKRLAVQVVPCTEFHHQINPTCTILLYKLDLKRNLVKLTILLKIYLIL